MRLVRNGYAFVIVDKPSGWLSVPSRQGVDDARPVVGTTLERELGCKLWPVHRLDEEVSGLLVFAKNAEAHRWASALFEARRVRKTYEALTLESECGYGREAAGLRGAPDSGCGPERGWESRLLRGKRRAYERPEGKPSLTLARDKGVVQVRGETARLWSLEPRTGRPHQLRYELMKRHAPIWGDYLYGSQRSWPPGGIALRAVSLRWDKADKPELFGLPEAESVSGLI